MQESVYSSHAFVCLFASLYILKQIMMGLEAQNKENM
jgi:hypothetical protein